MNIRKELSADKKRRHCERREESKPIKYEALNPKSKALQVKR